MFNFSNIFSFEGKINRKQFILNSISLVIITFLLSAFALFIGELICKAIYQSEVLISVAVISVIMITVVLSVFQVTNAVRRARDAVSRPFPEWLLVFALVVPFLNQLIMLVLLLVPSRKIA